MAPTTAAATCRSFLLLAITIGFVSLGCSRDVLVDNDGDAAVVRALWDPSTSTLPTPTDLVRDDATGRLELPLDPSLPAAELELRRYLNSLDGYPVSIALSLPLSDAIDTSTAADALYVFEQASGSRLNLDVGVEANDTKITAHGVIDGTDTPEQSSFAPGKTYLYALTGYGAGTVGARGEEVIADAAFSFVRSREPISAHAAAMPGKSEAERQQAAAALEAVQQSFAPVFDELTSLGVQRRNIAVAGSFTTTSQPQVWFDPLTKQIPLPNDLLMDRQHGVVNLPIGAEDNEDERYIKEGLSHYDGFSTTAALVLKSTQPLLRESIMSPEAVRVFRIDDASYEEVTDLQRGMLDDGVTFWVRPRLALRHSARYAYVVTQAAQAASGTPLSAQVFGALVRSSAPISIDGSSQVLALDDSQAQLVEPVRGEVAGLLDHLESIGLPRTSLAAAVPFDTLDAPRKLQQLRSELYQKNVPVDVSGVMEKTPWDRGLWLFLTSVRTIVTGKMKVLDHMDPYTTAFFPDGSARVHDVDFVLTIPKSAERGKPVPVVLFGHGLETSRELVYMIANKLADAGFAAFSLDLPMHGERSVCRIDLECADGASCASDGACVYDDGSLGRMRRVASPWPDGPSYPITSGLYFIDANDLFASRDHFLQATADLMQGLRVIRGADWETASGGYLLDGSDVVYLGMSLGGILGSVLCAVEPTITSFALNVPGANLVGLIQESAVFKPIISSTLSQKGIEPGTDAYFAFENAARWVLDPIEPLNIAHHAVEDPLPYVDPATGQHKIPPKKRVLLQMAQGDLVVPNSGTFDLAESMGLPISVYKPLVSNHAFLFDPTSLEGGHARDEVIEFFRDR